MSCQLKNTRDNYGSVAKFLHWLIFILVFVMIVGGFFLDDIPDEYKGVIYNLHKLTGLTILFLMMLRVFWALCNQKPAMPASSPRWQNFAARTTHVVLYVLVIAMPLAGWIGSSAAGKGPHIGDMVLQLPVPEDKSLKSLMFEMHELIAYLIIAFVSIHVLAALYHHFVLKDDVLRRMWPKRKCK